MRRIVKLLSIWWSWRKLSRTRWWLKSTWKLFAKFMISSLSHPTRHREESNSLDCFTFRNLIYIKVDRDAIRFSFLVDDESVFDSFSLSLCLKLLPYNLKLVWLPKKWWDEEERKRRTGRNKDGMYRIRKMLNDLWLQGYVQFYSLKKRDFSARRSLKLHFPALLIIIIIIIINIIIGEHKKKVNFLHTQ